MIFLSNPVYLPIHTLLFGNYFAAMSRNDANDAWTELT